MPIISAIFLSLAAGVITAIPGALSEFQKKAPHNIPLLVDVKTFWGQRLTRGEVFWFGLFVHLLMAALFGALYELIVVKSSIHPFGLLSLIVYASFFYLLVGGAIFPVVGAGLFGRREGKTVWYELLIVHYLFALIVWLAVYLFPALKP
jgi:hypothetical protein